MEGRDSAKGGRDGSQLEYKTKSRAQVEPLTGLRIWEKRRSEKVRRRAPNGLTIRGEWSRNGTSEAGHEVIVEMRDIVQVGGHVEISMMDVEQAIFTYLGSGLMDTWRS